jgi:hypothetical protein
MGPDPRSTFKDQKEVSDSEDKVYRPLNPCAPLVLGSLSKFYNHGAGGVFVVWSAARTPCGVVRPCWTKTSRTHSAAIKFPTFG